MIKEGKTSSKADSQNDSTSISETEGLLSGTNKGIDILDLYIYNHYCKNYRQRFNNISN